MHGTQAPSDWVCRWTHLIPAAAQVLDLACGGGRHMQWLAAQGHCVLGVDRDPQALALASAFGPTLQADLENAPWPLTGRTFDAVVVTHYLWRPLWPQILESLGPDGVLIYETFAQGHETVGRPSRADFLLAPGELLQVARQGQLRVLAYEDGCVSAPERFVQRIAAVRQSAASSPRRWPLEPASTARQLLQ